MLYHLIYFINLQVDPSHIVWTVICLAISINIIIDKIKDIVLQFSEYLKYNIYIFHSPELNYLDSSVKEKGK